MALNKNAATDKAPVTFENGDDSPIDTSTAKQPTAAERAKAQAAAYAAQQAAEGKEEAADKAESTERAVASPAKGGGAVVVPMAQANPYKALENQFPVDFNTFPQVQAKQGQFIYRDGTVKLGDVIGGEVISTQEGYMLSPGDVDNTESKEFLRYSKDGVTAENGDDMYEILELAKKAGFTKAKIQHRCTLVFNMSDDGKAAGKLRDKIVQIDLAPNSFNNWKRHQLNVAFKVQKGLLTGDALAAVAQVSLTAVPKEANSMSWTEVEFELLQK